MQSLPFDAGNVFKVTVQDLEDKLGLGCDGHCVKQEKEKRVREISIIS